MKGLSLFEFLIVVSIIIIAAGIVLGPLADFYAATQLEGVAEEGLSLLLKAKAQTLSSQGGSRYGVHFETSRMVVFQGTVFTNGASGNEEVPIPSKVEIASIIINGGGGDVIFKRLTGETDHYGAITFRLITNPIKTRVITIHPTGGITL